MNTITNEIATLPGVLGSCVSCTDMGLQIAYLPHGFSESMADDVATSVNRIAQMAKVKGLRPRTIAINYNKFIILTLTISETAILIILCTPNCNTSLVTTTATMLAPELAKSLQQALPPKKEIHAVDPPKQEKKPVQAKITPETNQALESLKQSLFETVGPIADMVFDDCVEQWTATSQGSLAGLPELLDHIAKELDNPPLFKEFKAKVSHFL